MDPVAFINKWIHLTSVIGTVGGIFFMRWVVLPGLDPAALEAEPAKGIIRRFGMTMPVSLTVVPVIHSDGPPSAVVVVARDITEQQVAQAALAEADVRVRETETLAHEGSWLWDVRTGAVQWTDELHRLVGLHPRDFDGTVEGHLAIVHGDDRDGVRDAMEAAVAKGELFEMRCRVVRPDGSEREVDVRGLPAAASAGTIVGLRGTIRPVTR